MELQQSQQNNFKSSTLDQTIVKQQQSQMVDQNQQHHKFETIQRSTKKTIEHYTKMAKIQSKKGINNQKKIIAKAIQNALKQPIQRKDLSAQKKDISVQQKNVSQSKTVLKPKSKEKQKAIPLSQKIRREEKKIQENSQEYQDQSSQSERPTRRRSKKSSSLADVTEQFIKLLKSSTNMTLCLNSAMKSLSLKKRRLYDIANVLQGIGYVEKAQRNFIRWVGGGQDPLKAMQIHFLKLYEKKQIMKQMKIKIEKQQIRNRINLLMKIKKNSQENNQLRVNQEKLQTVRRAHGQNTIALVFPMEIGQQFQFYEKTEKREDKKDDKKLVLKLNKNIKSNKYFYVLKPGQDMKKCNELKDIL